MSTDRDTIDPNVMRPIDEQRTGSGAKWIIGLGIGCGALLALCCGVGTLGLYFVGSSIQDAVIEDPQKIVELTNELTHIDIPEQLKPKLAINATIPFTDKTYFKGVVFDAEHNDATLMLGILGKGFQSDDAKIQSQRDGELRIVFESIAQGDKVDQHEDMVVENRRQKEVTIRGKSAVFNIATGKGVATRTPRIEVDGSFLGKNGEPVIMVLFADTKVLDEKQIDAMLESIK